MLCTLCIFMILILFHYNNIFINFKGCKNKVIKNKIEKKLVCKFILVDYLFYNANQFFKSSTQQAKVSTSS